MRKHIIVFGISIMALALIASWFVPTGTLRVLFPLDYWVEFVIPDGFSGEIVVDEDSACGVDPSVQSCRIYTYHVPSSGKLLVRSFALLNRFHFSIARYENGEAIATGSRGGMGIGATASQQKQLFYLGSIAKANAKHEQFIMFVGTISDYHSLRKQLGFGE